MYNRDEIGVTKINCLRVQFNLLNRKNKRILMSKTQFIGGKLNLEFIDVKF